MSVPLLRRDLAPQPDEAAPHGQALAHFRGVEVGDHGGQQFDRLVLVDDPVRLAEQRGRAHVGRQDFAVAVEDVGPRGRHRVGRIGAPHRGVVGRRIHHQPAGDDRIADAERDDGEPDARLRLGRAVDVAAVEQRAQRAGAARAPAAGASRADVWRGGCLHGLPLGSRRRDARGRNVEHGGIVQQRADRIGRVRRHQVGRPLRQIVELVELPGLDRRAA